MENNSLLGQKGEKPPPYTPSSAPQGSASWQPPPGYYPDTQFSTYQPSSYGTIISIPIDPVLPDIILVGACPACRVGRLQDDFSCLGILCAIFFFPLGILCCLLLRNRRCSNCGAYFG